MLALSVCIDERDGAYDLVASLRERLQGSNDLISSWISAFDMELNDKGLWQQPWDSLRAKYDRLCDDYDALAKDWNKFVPHYNKVVAPKLRNFGRPLVASPAQKAKVLRLRKGGASLRSIADQTGLGLRTVRTITEKAGGVDRATMARLKRIAPDRWELARQRISRRGRADIEKRLNDDLRSNDAVLKEARSLLHSQR